MLTLSFLAAISHMEEKLFDVVLLNLELQENKSRYNKCFITAETKSYKNPSVALGSICSEGDTKSLFISLYMEVTNTLIKI